MGEKKASATRGRKNDKAPEKPKIFRLLQRSRNRNPETQNASAASAPNKAVTESTSRTLLSTCCVCDTSLEFESGAASFRCTVCRTINDLKLSTVPTQPRPFTVEEIEALAATSSTKKECQTTIDEIRGRISCVFSSAQCLNESFPSSKQISHSDCSMDLYAVRKMYKVFGKHPSLMESVLSATESLLNRPGKKIRAVHDSIFLLILLENPLLVYRRHKVVGLAGHHLLSKILGLLSSLSHEIHQYFVNWFGRQPRDIFKQRIDLINRFLSHRLAKLYRNPARDYSSCWQVRAASRTMALFFSANAIKAALPSSSFYNSFTDYIDLDADYIAWKNRRAGYTFCQFPFFISLQQKQKILAIDAYRQMALKQREVYFNALEGKVEEMVFRLVIRRPHLLDDSLVILAGNEDHFKKKLIVHFADEDGIDAGGLRKEYFLLLCREVFHSRFGLFLQDEGSNYCWFNPAKNDQKFVSYYHLLGVVLGLALYNSVMLDVNLPPALFRKLLGQPCGLSDLGTLDPELAKGLHYMLDFQGDVESTFMRNFVVEHNTDGSTHVVPLCPNGENVMVTNENRWDYVQAYVKYIFTDSCSRSMFHLSRGFHQVAGGNALSLFQAEEVELLIRGSPDPLSIKNLQSVCIYDGFPLAQSDPLSEPTVSNFWAIFDEMTPDKQKALLSFVTGSDRVPATGTVDLKLRVSMDLAASSQKLPMAHTCTSQIVLPRYNTKEELGRKLIYAMNEGGIGFTIA